MESGNRLTDIVNTVTHKVNGYISDELKYKYDNNGNIIAICREGEPEVSTECGYDECGNPICTTTTTKNDVPVFEYVYDGLNRLIRENNYVLGKTYTYKYDAAGNILSKSTYDVTSGAGVTPTDVKLYNYANTGWKDKLTSYDGVGITYDSMGNPLSYRGHSLEWSRIRLLTKWDNVVMDYNASGIRTRKGDTYYELDGDTIISETTNGNTIRYYYGSSGVVGFRYNGTRYYYEKNLQGDIIAIYDESGNKVGGYAYDAWGNCTITTDINNVATANPFRYRGYYYDSDLGLYYLKSRYYDAQVGRFINADRVMGVNRDMSTYNLFAYCGNNPVSRYDVGGMLWKKLISGILHGANNFAIAIGIDTAAVGAFFLEMEKDNSGVYHATFDCWQQYLGYNKLYDFAFDLGTSMVSAQFSFSYNGCGYTIWAWKGDYINLGAGAELGIYLGSSGQRTVDTSLAMWMGMVVTYNNERIIEYFPHEDQWWITGFNPKYQNIDAHDLSVTIGVGFNSSGMYYAFKNQWGGDPRWSFYDDRELAILQF